MTDKLLEDELPQRGRGLQEKSQVIVMVESEPVSTNVKIDKFGRDIKHRPSLKMDLVKMVAIDDLNSKGINFSLLSVNPWRAFLFIILPLHSTSNPKLMSDTLISFLENFEPTNEVQILLQDIILLQAKFNKNDDEDLFFQTSKELHVELLNLGKEKYAKLVKFVNDGSIEQFTSHIQKIKVEIKQFTNKYEMNSITGQKVNSLNRQLQTVETIMIVKEKYSTLKPLNELIEDEKSIMELFS